MGYKFRVNDLVAFKSDSSNDYWVGTIWRVTEVDNRGNISIKCIESPMGTSGKDFLFHYPDTFKLLKTKRLIKEALILMSK